MLGVSSIMSKIEKLIDRFLSKPTDFTWQELKKLMSEFGFEESNCGKTSGSRVRFVHYDHPPVILHKPHPGNILKRYQLDQIFALLRQEELL
jgi:hypothetical protein